jgi:hypothetical protein
MTYETSASFQISELYQTALFEALPGSCILLQNNVPHFTVLAATPEYLQQTGYKKESIIGNGFSKCLLQTLMILQIREQGTSWIL